MTWVPVLPQHRQKLTWLLNNPQFLNDWAKKFCVSINVQLNQMNTELLSPRQMDKLIDIFDETKEVYQRHSSAILRRDPIPSTVVRRKSTYRKRQSRLFS